MSAESDTAFNPSRNHGDGGLDSRAAMASAITGD